MKTHPLIARRSRDQIGTEPRLSLRSKRIGLAFTIVAAICLTQGEPSYARIGVGGGVGPGTRGVGVAGVGVRGVGARGVGVAPGIGVAAAALPHGYLAAVPAGYAVVAHAGYQCRFVGGVYYRAMMYQGQTVWVVVT